MKRLIILLLLMTFLVACSSTKEADKEVIEDTEVEEVELEKDVDEKRSDKKDEIASDKEESKDEPGKKEEKESSTEESKEKPVKKEVGTVKDNKKESEKTPTETPKKDAVEKADKKKEKDPVVNNEEVEVAAENIIRAQDNRDYAVLKGYLGQNITLNEKDNMLKITNVDYPHEAELLKGIKESDLEHRFTHDGGQDQIVGFAVTDYEKEMSYTIDLTMRVGKDSWKMLNMQINK